MIWVKILLGKCAHCENAWMQGVLMVMFAISRLNQSLSWPYREVVATALYDFSPVEANQLALRQGCQVLVIGKEGDSKGWWRGKTMDKVCSYQ